MLTDYDLHLLGEGRHWKSYERLGAQLQTIDGVRGVNFAVWAPNADDVVSVVGEFNGWDGRAHRMHKRIPSGIWELFVPGLDAGTLYKFRVHAAGGHSDRTDPYGFGAEVPPRTASRVIDLAAYEWRDGEWMARRADRERPLGAAHRSTRCTSAAGGGRATIRTAGSRTPTWSANSSPTSSRWGSRTSSSCPPRSIRSRRAGDTRRSACSRRRAGSDRRRR